MNRSRSAEIVPSLLSADFARLGEEAEAMVAIGARRLHFDVMDNHYVPNLTIGPLVLSALRRFGIAVPVEVHLMVRPVDRLIEEFARSGATVILIHPEATDHLDRSLALIRDHGCEAGLVLNPATPPSVLPYAADRLEHLLVMTVNPGFPGQSFLPGVLPKIREIRSWIDAHGGSMTLEVDGGIHMGTIGPARAAGADRFVAGSALFGASDRAKAWADLQAALDGKENPDRFRGASPRPPKPAIMDEAPGGQ
jgi:ribulose-phosphate 3-epimerase